MIGYYYHLPMGVILSLDIATPLPMKGNNIRGLSYPATRYHLFQKRLFMSAGREHCPLLTSLNECRYLNETALYRYGGPPIRLGTPGSTPLSKLKQKETELLPDEDTCGPIYVDSRITKGKDAQPGQFPWMALLGFRS